MFELLSSDLFHPGSDQSNACSALEEKERILNAGSEFYPNNKSQVFLQVQSIVVTYTFALCFSKYSSLLRPQTNQAESKCFRRDTTMKCTQILTDQCSSLCCRRSTQRRPGGFRRAWRRRRSCGYTATDRCCPGRTCRCQGGTGTSWCGSTLSDRNCRLKVQIECVRLDAKVSGWGG